MFSNAVARGVEESHPQSTAARLSVCLSGSCWWLAVEVGLKIAPDCRRFHSLGMEESDEKGFGKG